MSSEEVAALREELAIIRASIESLQESEDALTRKLQLLLDGPAEDEINFLIDDFQSGEVGRSDNRSSEKLIDFTSEYKPSPPSLNDKKVPWDWTETLHESMKKIWGIERFRLNQEAVCNAVLSNRDVLVIMPTGGGKSLTYQLPAILSEGTTLVISPLVALMADQNMHLKEAGVPAEMLNASTTRQAASLIMKRLLHSVPEQNGQRSKAKGKGKASESDDVSPIKLCYVTPEKIAKSKTFVSTLQKMYGSKRLSRVIIDEAHCCSSMGHDFRPDYKQLSILKTLFPDTPIVALTATCPPRVMADVLKILKLGPITKADKAKPTGTVLFTSPLSRPNLHYQVLKKPASANDLIDQIVEWIEQNHSGCQGIVYTLSQKDTATVAQGLISQSKGRITAGIYHASLSDSQKHQVHTAWRGGSIQVVCATTAFGMGIDAPHVRFVIHQTLPKSLEGYYQESGRAGRDGQISDCLLFWKTTDLIRLSGMVASETDGIEKLYSMTRFATELERCRSLLFAEYFNTSHSASDSILPFSQEPCGHCDNCKREPADIKHADLTVEALKICDVVGHVNKMGGRVTLIQLGDLVRGIGTPMATIIRNTQAKKNSDDIECERPGDLSGPDLTKEKIFLKKEQVENLILILLLRGYLQEQFVATAYTVNSYIKLGPKSRVLISNRREITSSGKEIPSHIKLLIPSITTTTSLKKTKTSTITKSRKTIKAGAKKRKIEDESDSSVECSKENRAGNLIVSDSGDENGFDDEDDDDQPIHKSTRQKPTNRRPNKKMTTIEIDSEEDE
ncbi:hypothetical protein MJO29_003436 [Puccinia striiformis f. sp. tritici]|uniref:hypothetical protein n=1 Tax=Puccinia striiformis f. sp. tritici TaxID=168172 RepID=UPI00200850D1|nr:hypothetical protein Pst134EA_033291 [Puccinia striiformis f. sp. tritici]KAH9470778.1 hypothetical protein Pst134EA_033291 [Puccinia striiformis f. sp. tritici]KAI7965338.1 hypothetical protein MJO29_003436 [Puccinia striiformis f. sp. tritici]